MKQREGPNRKSFRSIMEIILFFLAHWYLSLFSQTFFHHRYAAHRMFSMSPFWERFFYLFSFITQGSSYLSPYSYGVLHRMHHANADTEDDPHSPSYDRNLFSMMWRTKTIYSDISKGKADVPEVYTKQLPNWKSLDRFADNLIVRGSWVLLYTAFYILFAPHWAFFLLLPLHFVMGPLHGAIINWFAHKYGYTNFKTKDTSRNLMPIDILMMGEGFHNNHHKYQKSPNFGKRWFELDPVYPAILLFKKLRIIRLAGAS
jgi:stearoyl-CoA desaturase (delta-9 desaturase)